MSDYMKPVLLVGCGYMGQEYARVLKALATAFIAVGRGKTSASAFFEKTGVQPYIGGLEHFVSTEKALPSRAIVAVSAEQLYDSAKLLILSGVKEILLEKPGAIYYSQIDELDQLAQDHGCQVYIAYNRRFYASVQAAKKLIEEDGGVSSFYFEFTEWSHKIKILDKSCAVLENWFLCNSTHVLDLAFYLGGSPEHLTSYVSGSLSWYPNASSFAGAGMTWDGASFSYRADWESAGRWGVEILTKKRKLILCPLEELKIQKRGTVTVGSYDINDALDQQFKPGLYLQTKAFLDKTADQLLSLHEHNIQCKSYKCIEYGEHFKVGRCL